MTGAGDLAELVRLPAACTVPGDTLAGGAAAGFPHGHRTAWLSASSLCLYWSGMALNDWADRHEDAMERPERPIPSGRVSPGRALGLASALTCAGLAAAARGGGRDALGVALPLAGTVWAYDLALKSTPWGPGAMAAARGLDVLLGAGRAAAGRAAVPAVVIAAHTLAVTSLSRHEVHGDPRGTAAGRAALVTSALTAVLAGRPTARPSAGFAAAYAGTVLPPQLRARRDRRPERVRQAVGAGILGIIPVQSSLLAASDRTALAVAVGALLPLGRATARRIAVT